MPDIRPSAQGIDYNMALGDIEEFIKEKRERGWSHLDILEAISALGRAGKEQINIMLEDMADMLEDIGPVPHEHVDAFYKED